MSESILTTFPLDTVSALLGDSFGWWCVGERDIRVAKLLVLHRGIGLVPESKDRDKLTIQHTGHLTAKSAQAYWIPSPTAVKERLSALARAPRNIRDEISRLQCVQNTYACGDLEGAARYAVRSGGVPVVVSFKVLIDELIIDGRDFLYAVFQLWDRDGISHRERVRESLSALFGPTTLRWFDLSCGETDSTSRIGLCDLAVHDRAAIEHHHSNMTNICGRYDRVFRSAFALPASIAPSAILDVQEIDRPPNPPNCMVRLNRDLLIP